MSLNRKFRTVVALITAICFSYNSYAASSVVVESLYNYAHNKQISKIRYMLNTMGYNIDVEDEDGVTAWCIAKESNDTCAMGVLEQMGANTEQRCGLPWGYIGAAAGVLAVGGIAAAMGGGGGGGSSDPCSGVVCGDNQHCLKGSCICDEGYLDFDGVCYADLNCSVQANSTGIQNFDKCECNTGYTGTLCTECDNGYGNYGTSECYPTLDCGKGTQQGSVCVCDTGWKQDASGSCTECDTGYGNYGTSECYPTLDCGKGTQQGGVCVCDTGWKQDASGSCTECDTGYDNFGTSECYPVISDCGYGTQQGGVCVCNTGYTTDASGSCTECDTGYGNYGTSECYPTIADCGKGEQKGGVCDCDTGWTTDDDGSCTECAPGYDNYGTLECHPTISDCGRGSQQGGVCVCDTGWKQDASGSCTECASGYGNYGTSECYQTLDCGNGTQQGDVCVCNTGYTTDASGSCTECASGYGNYGTSECYQTLDCGNGTQQGNTCVCDYGYYRNGTGKCVPESEKVTMNTFDGNNNHMNKESVSKTQNNYGDVYGLVYDADPGNPSESIVGYQYDMYMNYLENTEESDNVVNTRNLTLNNLGDGNVYGLYSENVDNIYVTYLDLQAVATQGEQNTELNINNGGIIKESDGLVSGGNGNVYAVWSTGSTNIYNIAQDVSSGIENNLNTSSEINVTSIGSGDVYGMYNDDSGNIYNSLYDVSDSTHKTTEIAKIDVESTGSGKVYGIYSVSGDVVNSGIINATSNNAAAWGISNDSGASISNSGNIDVDSTDGSAFGMQSYYATIENLGEITVSSSNKNAYGIYTSEGTANNSGDIDVSSTGGNAYGIYSGSGDVYNYSTIKASSTNGNAYGIYALGSSYIFNSGNIEVSGNDDKIYGIYATNGATVDNSGTIKLNSDTCDGSTCDGSSTYNNFIVLDTGSLFLNRGLTVSSSSLDFDDNNGTVALGKGGTFKASSISGKLAVDTSVVEDGFDDTYVENEALQSSNIDVNVTSNSAMFEANVQNNDGQNSANIVLTRKSFDELSASSSIAKFLETNYNQQNNESLFNVLKKASLHTYSAVEAQNLGYGLLPNFAHENLNVLRNLNSTLNDELFETTGTIRKIVGYDSLYQSRDTKGTLTGYENYANTMYFMYDKELDNLVRTGLGMSITQFSSDYDDDSNRKEVMAQMLVPVSYIADNISYASIARLGYADGKYERQTPNGKFESDLTSWIYGLSNQARYNMDLGFMELEPTVEFNVLGYYQNRIRENKNKIGAIKADGENNLSLEAGIGLNAKKDVEFDKNNKLSFKASAMYYHEFAKPYHSLEASVYNMAGTYKITDYENIYDRDRAMLSLGLDYSYKPFTIYGKFRQFIEDENPFEANAGIKYNF
ncbi:MAG: hypothetical protein E7016_00595 [Alphaproteobacteria bacterium]|nr:hypothetical protein [Alphaproteobacteria bacterium]